MVRLITDSAADMEAEDYEKNGITCIPISVAFGEKVYYENVSLTKTEFYRLQGKEKEFPKTAQPTPQTYLDAFQDAKDAGDQVVFLSMSSKISGAYQSAVLAKDMLEFSECYVIDSCTATGGQRILLEHAVLLRDVGLKAKAIIEAIEELKKRIVIYACMDTLECLRRGGRISRRAYAIGTLANIKPILYVTHEGQVTVPGRAQGMRRGMSYMLKKIEECPPDPAFPIHVMYTSDQEVGKQFADYLNKHQVANVALQLWQVGAAIGAHV
ncbi:MAG: DegV family protein, partial [Oscillospiraceae bacterium]|nr:DegV family protein [Oscillospiraceae bacterium]